MVAALSFGLVVAVAATLFLSALRGRASVDATLAALATIGALVGLGVVAVALRSFTAPFLISGGGPERATTTPMLNVVDNGFRDFRFGLGSAGSVPLLVALGLMGLLAVGLLVATRSGIEVMEVDTGSDAAGGPAWASAGRWSYRPCRCYSWSVSLPGCSMRKGCSGPTPSRPIRVPCPRR